MLQEANPQWDYIGDFPFRGFWCGEEEACRDFVYNSVIKTNRQKAGKS